MYEEPIERLTTHAESYEEIFGEGETSIMMRQAADVIEELIPFKKQVEKGMGLLDRAEELLNAVKPRWVSVTKRLPEDEEMVLCFTPVDGFMFVGFHVSYKWGSNTVSKWKIITAMRSTKDITKKVTHWMPLPEPPKEET